MTQGKTGRLIDTSTAVTLTGSVLSANTGLASQAHTNSEPTCLEKSTQTELVVSEPAGKAITALHSQSITTVTVKSEVSGDSNPNTPDMSKLTCLAHSTPPSDSNSSDSEVTMDYTMDSLGLVEPFPTEQDSSATKRQHMKWDVEDDRKLYAAVAR